MPPRLTARRTLAFVSVVVVLVIAVVLSLMVGRQALSPVEVVRALIEGGTGNTVDIVRGLRLERTLVALAVGAALGAAGALMQALTRNPLADPGLLGVNAGAAAAVVTGFTFFGITSALPQMWLGLVGAAVASVVVYLVGSGGRASAGPARLALAGAALTAVLFSYINALAMSDQATYNEVRFWVVGSVVNRGLDTLVIALPFLVLGVVLALIVGPGLNALALGEDSSRSLGLGVGRIRVLTAVSITLLCGAATAVAGPIGFLGLTVPHVARAVVGADQRRIIPFGMLLSAAFLVLADTLGRVVSGGAEIEAGLMTAILGGPVFIALVRRRRMVPA
ncbi:iron chelate uptake ABC transporter family permease subunit [Herbiconiux moechotypicola]|uniref:Iron chelate uptake ABC transporter family permease subunit n=1 Tax=Herbiconiux moechotypicola TaxID=637393 RepID=A0ABP5Q9C9_9MICO|nr:iron chelate uptake ABC transporter family permease subunit [Herbiconiux moechotypicola]MCS5729376.1 iron chelate uptake ABC transporter family permease subunit [Herbiconiux moechotypicola]